MSQTSVSIPSEGLLFEKGFRKLSPRAEPGDMPKFFFGGNLSEGYSIDFDLLSAFFYIVSQYGRYSEKQFDSHGRCIESKEEQKLNQLPIAELYAEHLWSLLKARYPQLQRKEKVFDYKITFDIDSPYRFRHKGLGIGLASLAKNILSLRFGTVSAQISTLLGNKDPYDVYDLILSKIPASKLCFFFLVDRHSRHDGRFNFRNKAYQKLIRKLALAGVQIGIHPSYNSFRDKEMIAFETEQLGVVSGVPIKASRMHFLKYRLPDTFQHLIDCGIEDDYSLCPIQYVGFKTGMARPYPWYNLATETETKLILHPTFAMDRAMQQYLRLSPAEAWAETIKLIDICQERAGVFTMLFHNDSLSETAEWKGWKMLYENTIAYLSALKQAD